MLILRPFAQADWPVLVHYQYPTMTEIEAKQLITEYNSGFYNGRRMQMLAVEADSILVGYVSLLDLGDGTASEGVEIYPPYRRQGFAYVALQQLLNQAIAYRTVTAQIRKDNAASLALHRKLMFQITGEFVNRRGHEVYSLSLALPQEIGAPVGSSQ